MQKDMQQQMDAIQLLLQNHAVRVSNLEEKINNSMEKKETSHQTTCKPDSQTSKNTCYFFFQIEASTKDLA